MTQPGDGVTLGIRENPGHISISGRQSRTFPTALSGLKPNTDPSWRKVRRRGWTIFALAAPSLRPSSPRRILILINAALTLIVARQTFTLRKWFKYVALLTICIGSMNGLFQAHGIKGATHDGRYRSPGA